MKILICDDDRNVLEEMKTMMQKLLGEYMPDENNAVYTVENLFKFDEYIESKNIIPDVIFMDINLNDSGSANGIDIAINIKEHIDGIKIVFFTGNIEYSESIFRAEPFDFIVKPVCENRLHEVFERLVASSRKHQNKTIVIKAIKGIHRIAVSAVNYVESSGRYIYIYTDEGIVKAINKLDNLGEMLGKDFVKCHKSFLVNISRIKKLEGSGITLLDGTEIAVSKKYKPDVKKAFLACT